MWQNKNSITINITNCNKHDEVHMTMFGAAAALPTLDIAEGALDKLFAIYKQLLPGMGGYLTHAGELNRSRLEMVLHQLAALELETLEQRAQVCLHSLPLLADRQSLPGACLMCMEDVWCMQLP